VWETQRYLTKAHPRVQKRLPNEQGSHSQAALGIREQSVMTIPRDLPSGSAVLAYPATTTCHPPFLN